MLRRFGQHKLMTFVFICFFLFSLFLMRERKKMKLGGSEWVEDLGGTEGQERI